MSKNENYNSSSAGQQDIQDLPPLSQSQIAIPNSPICETMQLYLAVWNDLTPRQMRAVEAHIQACPRCMQEQKGMRNISTAFAQLPATQPSAHVDRAILEAIAARSRATLSSPSASSKDISSASLARWLPANSNSNLPRRRTARRPGVPVLALAAVLVVALLSALYFALHMIMPGSSQTTFILPTNVSWNNYVLNQEQTIKSTSGSNYHVICYHNMSDDSMNIEITGANQFDVVVVKDPQKALSLDMVNRVAQWGMPDWAQIDDSIFDASHLRADLASGRAVYLGTSLYQGQEVYRIRLANNKVMLLNMKYIPVNVLDNVDQNGNGQTVYQFLHWLPPSQVPDSMWDITIPGDFHIGTLPTTLS